MSKFKVYIGWDEREDVAYQVCKYSLLRHASTDVRVIPLKHRKLRELGLFWRPWLTEPLTGERIDMYDHKPFSTEFSHTRFLVPELQNFNGWALFMDCDMLWKGDIKHLINKLDDDYAVMCVKHNHKPDEQRKMDDQPQAAYWRKNWSSFMAFNCSHPANKKLTKWEVNSKTGRWMHTFEWLQDQQIGSLPFEYNWIEGVTFGVNKPRVVHYTLGGPWFSNCQDVQYGEDWIDEYERWQREADFSISEVPTMKFGG